MVTGGGRGHMSHVPLTLHKNFHNKGARASLPVTQLASESSRCLLWPPVCHADALLSINQLASILLPCWPRFLSTPWPFACCHLMFFSSIAQLLSFPATLIVWKFSFRWLLNHCVESIYIYGRQETEYTAFPEYSLQDLLPVC